MIKYVLLYKDGSLSYMDDWKEKFDLIEYMLIYADEENDTFIMIKPTDYLFTMTSATVKLEAIIKQQIADDDAYDYDCKPFTKVNKTFTDPLEFITFLYSLYRVYYVNDVFASGDTHVFYQIRFYYIKVSVYCGNNRTFHYKNSYDKERAEFGCGEILTDLKKLIGPNLFNDQESFFVNIHPVLKQWKVTDTIFRDCLVGVPLYTSKLIVFREWADWIFLNDRIEGFYTSVIFIDDITKMELQDVRDFAEAENDHVAIPFLLDYMASDMNVIIEYITLFPYLLMSEQIILETYFYGKLNGLLEPSVELTMDCRDPSSNEEFSINDWCSLTDIFTIDDLISILWGGDSDEE